MRGDRPVGRNCYRNRKRPPPRARGSTCPTRAQTALSGASPACAGIDPPAPSPRAPPAGLPRVRGDRPAQIRWRQTVGAPPPRARGSTRGMSETETPAAASPACAGIDLLASSVSACCLGLPRVRGDRPDGDGVCRSAHAPPPRARGSTRGHHEPVARPRASPACAGIDPAWPRLPASICGLPRVRGDRPLFSGISTLSSAPPPRARGSTRGALRHRHRQAASPACAGIDPRNPVEIEVSPGLPRVRGDRPAFADTELRTRKPPPRARGSTPACRQRARRA